MESSTSFKLCQWDIPRHPKFSPASPSSSQLSVADIRWGLHTNVSISADARSMTCVFQVIIIMYIDDILILGLSFEDCQAKTRY